MEKTKKNKRILIICIAGGLVLAVLITGLAFSLVGILKDKAFAGIGDQFDELEYAAQGSSSVTYASTHTVTDFFGKGKLSMKCGALSGIKTLWRTSRGGAAAALEHEESWTEGRLKLVLVREDGTVEDLTGQPSPYEFTTQNGDRLRLIGDAAQDVRVSLAFEKDPGSWED